MAQDLLVPPGAKIALGDFDPSYTAKYESEAETLGELNRLKERLYDLQGLLYAHNRYAVLIVIQAMDTGGKDGLIRSVMSGLDPTGCQVTSFKEPSADELQHGFLWRVHRAVPGYGTIGIFNRSHYEDVLVARVHDLVPKEAWKARYEQINDFEKLLSANRIVIRKFFLHISREEQERRLMKRLVNPTKNWKFSVNDVRERAHWDDYMRAYEDAISRCSTPWAPWTIIPADKKWFRNLVAARILVQTLETLDMHWPEPTPEVSEMARRARETGHLPEV